MISEFNNKKKLSDESLTAGVAKGKSSSKGYYQKIKSGPSAAGNDTKALAKSTPKSLAKKPASAIRTNEQKSASHTGRLQNNKTKQRKTYSTTKKTVSRRRNTAQSKPSVKVAFLGGLNEIGKNITIFECCD